MPFSGTGIFTRVYNWVNDAANGLLVDATRMDTDTNDIADGLSNCITRDGQSPPTSDLPMGARKLTGLGAGTLASDSVNYGQVFNQPTFTAPSALANAGLNAPPLRLATIGDLLTAAFQTALPAQAIGFLRSDGTAASFGTTHTGYAQNEVKGADIASAATINLTTATGNLVHVTGTTAITAIAIPIGAERAVIFDGALTLTNGAALLLPTGANIVTAAGDRALIRGDTAGAVVTHYQRADGTPLAQNLQPQTYTLLTQATVSAAVANIDFLNAFSGTYDKYVIEVTGIRPSANDTLCMRLAAAGVPDSSSSYSAVAGSGGGLTFSISQFSFGGNNYGTTRGSAMTFEVRGANNTSEYKGLGVRGWHFSATTSEALLGEGAWANLAACTGFRLYWSGGANFTAGTVRIYGVRNT